ncbi:MAG: hypothetical protein ACLR2Z_02270 [Haemophilus parainfluenzae]|jgi:uncharacterized protein PM1237|uniref:hypothetical protein n=1 Tax=Haemophilus parainfluenzae TaxID=729 RepID=UPI0018A56993|nr:hypothetical protein [Haemophilus parainfluenzae]QOR21707.1 hypothetical protein INP92_03505 [Haemophilus parainfluenzae]
MENMIKVKAMRAAGIACFLVLAIIGAWIFTTPSSDIVDALAEAGKMVGGGATYGTFMLAACPPVAGFIAYYFWKWVIK